MRKPDVKREHRVLTDPSPDNLRAFFNEYTRMRRALNAFTQGDERLEAYAETFGGMDMKRPEDAVRACRKHVFGEQYLEAPLCQIEQDIAASRPGIASILVAGDEICAKAVERQLREQAAAAARPPEFRAARPDTGPVDTPSADDIKRAFSEGAGAVVRPVRRK